MTLPAHHPLPSKPILAVVVQIVAIVVALAYAIDVGTAFLWIGRIGIVTALLSVLIAAIVAILSFQVFRGLERRTPITVFAVRLYLWGMLLLYPLLNLLRWMDLYMQRPHVPDVLLGPAALFELGRFAVFLMLVFWAGLGAEGLRRYLSAPVRGDASAVVTTAG